MTTANDADIARDQLKISLNALLGEYSPESITQEQP